MLEQCARCCKKEKGNRKWHMPVRKIRVGSRWWEAILPWFLPTRQSHITYKMDSSLWEFQGDFKKKVRRLITLSLGSTDF